MGWFPLGTRKQGSRPFAAPTPPNRNGAGPKAGLETLPPACPRTLTAGRHMVIEVPPLPERGHRQTTSMLGSGTRTVTQQVVLLS